MNAGREKRKENEKSMVKLYLFHAGDSLSVMWLSAEREREGEKV
jgi:hypothetical protein